jgi:expansin (peptidoglycan-binding protein)
MENLYGKTQRTHLIELLEIHGLKHHCVTIIFRDRSYGDSIDGVLDTSNDFFAVVKNINSDKILAIVPWEVVEQIRIK